MRIMKVQTFTLKQKHKRRNNMILDRGEQFVWDWQYRLLGGFKESLAHTIQQADTNNQMKLLLAFPVEVQAIIDYQSKEGYWTSIQDKIDKVT